MGPVVQAVRDRGRGLPGHCRTRGREQLRTTHHTGRAVNAAKVWLATVARHLSKGRDAGDIAVRENMRVAKVLEAIASIQSPGIQPEQQTKGKP